MTEAMKAWRAANKEHLAAYAKERRRIDKEQMATMTHRHCFTCGTNKPAAEFYPSCKTMCRACSKAKAAPMQELKRQRTREWKANNPERLKEWYESNKDHRRQYARELYARDPEFRERRARNLQRWVKANPHKARANSARREAAQLKATPQWADHQAIAAVYRLAAQLTATTGIPHEVDHIVPLRSRIVCGLHCAHNLQVLTKVDNRRKSNHLIEHKGPSPSVFCEAPTQT